MACQVRDMLDRDEGAQRRVLGGVGQQAFSEFKNLVTKLTDTSVQIQDINVRIIDMEIVKCFCETQQLPFMFHRFGPCTTQSSTLQITL